MKQFFLMGLLAFSATGFSQKVTNKLSFQKGQKLEMVTKINTLVSIEMMGQAMDTKIEATVTRLFDVADVTAGVATIEHKMKRMQMNIEAPMAGAQTFDSENEADMKGEGGKAMEKALKNKYTVSVDAMGKVTAIKADDDNPNKTGAAPQATDMFGGSMGQQAGAVLPKVGDASEFKILPNREVSKGETWTDSTKGTKATYTIADITSTDVIINFTEEGKTERKQEANGMELKITTKDKTTGKITLDAKTGLLKEKTGVTDSQGTMEIMGQEAPMTTKTTTTTTTKG